MDYILPSSTYVPPPRQVRGSILNTIIEDHEEPSFGRKGQNVEDSNDGTLYGRPVALEAKHFVAPRQSRIVRSSSPVSDASSRPSTTNDDPNGESDNETEFSESCPSLRDSISSRPTSLTSESTRSIASCPKNTRNRFPTIMIPKGTTRSSFVGTPVKNSPITLMTPSKTPLSPANLTLLPRYVPASNALPSLDGSSMTSDQISQCSAPVTPDIQSVKEGVVWGGHQVRLRQEPESAHDEVHSDSQSEQEDILFEAPEDWDLLGSFPRIPGATPQDLSPILPEIPLLETRSPHTAFDKGVQLPSDALRTLNHLALEHSPSWSERSVWGKSGEMQEMPVPPSRPRSAEVTPASSCSAYSFSSLSIPSPGGFFSSLKAGARHTWCMNRGDVSTQPPTSTTAENFYNVPWRGPERIVEQVVDYPERNTEALSTAKRAYTEAPSTAPITARRISEFETQMAEQSRTAAEHIKPQEIRYEYKDAYENELIQQATANFDRTSEWLGAQTSYLSALRETNPANDPSTSPITLEHQLSELEANPAIDFDMIKAISPIVQAFIESPMGPNFEIEDNKETIYNNAVQHLVSGSRKQDALVHAIPRFDAIQTNRIAQIDLHLEQLQGKFKVREHKRPAYSGPFLQHPKNNGTENSPTRMAFIEVEREKGVLEQVRSPTWAVEAIRFLNHGTLLAKPAADRLARATLPLDDPKCSGTKRRRVLDLGGNTSCDWAWHVAHEYPNVKTYTVVTQAQATNADLKSPANHSSVTVPHLTKLPFRDGYFDVISARSMHALLKHEPVPGQSQIDEYDMCLKDCLRILKPGGVLEFMVMDSAISHAGSLGSKMSVEFGFNLKTRGYDPVATRAFLGRLRKAGFVHTKRAWVFLPMGVTKSTSSRPDEASIVNEHAGGTATIAHVSGLLGSWLWEQWMLKIQLEMGREKEKLLEGVDRVILEGRRCGAGWNCLCGWARKPMPPRKEKAKKEKEEHRETMKFIIEDF